MVLLSYGMPALSFAFMAFQSGAVQLYFFVSAILAFGQSRLLTNESARKFLGLYPMNPNPNPPIVTLFPPSTTTGSGSKSRFPTTAAPTSGASATGSAGLKLYHHSVSNRSYNNSNNSNLSISPSTSTLPSSAPKTRDISMIDKIVDGAKAQRKELKEGIYKVFGTTKEKKVQENKRANALRRADDYDKVRENEDEVRKMEESGSKKGWRGSKRDRRE